MVYRRDNPVITIIVLAVVAVITAAVIGLLHHRSRAEAALDPAVTLATTPGHSLNGRP
jgi:hypothetical protein